MNMMPTRLLPLSTPGAAKSLHFGKNKPPKKDPNAIDEAKLDFKMLLAKEQGKTPISLFVKTTGDLTDAQVAELKTMGLDIYARIGSINTARLQSFEKLGKITQLPYITRMEGAQVLRPN
jgi:hypothetical protein